MPRCLLLLAAAAMAAALAGTSPAAQAPAGDAEIREAGVPAPVMKVEVRDGLLSVELAGAVFSDVMKAVAARSGIRADVTGDVAVRPVTTRFRDMELEDGIMRLLSLVQERNFFFSYDEKGRLKHVEIYGAVAPVKTQKKDRPAGQKASQPEKRTSMPSSSPPAVRKNPPASQRIIRPSREETPAPQQREADQAEDLKGSALEETPSGFPSEKPPQYIPPPPLNP